MLKLFVCVNCLEVRLIVACCMQHSDIVVHYVNVENVQHFVLCGLSVYIKKHTQEA